MELTLKTTKVEGAQNLPAESFGIGNMALVIEILRSKMYSDPIKTITQEVMSNGRDAHRELGNPTRPVEVKLPNRMDQRFWVRDFGVGITPHRMSNVFLMYGNSTKRDSNEETGCFGLGAKSPFSYVDNFEIETYLPAEAGEQGGARGCVKRRYVALVDETRIGKLYCVDGPVGTDEERGTKILVSCKPGDDQKFQQSVARAARYWDKCPNSVRPAVKGHGDWSWPEDKVLYEGTGWQALSKYGQNNQYEQGVLAIVDGIPYPVEKDSLWTGDHKEDELFRSFNLLLQFKTGDLALTANRESVDYQERTRKAISDRLKVVWKELGASAQRRLDSELSLWEANVLWKRVEQDIGKFLDKPTWHGTPVRGDFPTTGILKTYSFHKRNRNGTIMVKRSEGAYFKFGADDDYRAQKDGTTRMFLQDEAGEPSIYRVQHLVRSTDGQQNAVTTVHVVRKYDRPPVDGAKYDAEWAKAVKEHGLDELLKGLSPFSQVPKWKPVRAARAGGAAPSGYTLPRGKLMGEHAEWQAKDDKGNVHQIDVAKGKGYFVQLYDETAYIESPDPKKNVAGKTASDHSLADAAKALDVKLWGIHTPFIKQVGPGWTPFKDFLEAELKKLYADKELAEEAAELGSAREWTLQAKLPATFGFLAQGKVTPTRGGLLERYAEASKHLSGVIERLDKARIVHAALGLPGDAFSSGKKPSRLKGMHDAVVKAMPFLSVMEKVNYYGYGREKEFPHEEIQWYVEQRDPYAVNPLPPPTPKGGKTAKELTDAECQEIADDYKSGNPRAGLERLEAKYGLRPANGMTAKRAVDRAERLAPAKP